MKNHSIQFELATQTNISSQEIADSFAEFLRHHPFSYGKPDVVRVLSKDGDFHAHRAQVVRGQAEQVANDHNYDYAVRAV